MQAQKGPLISKGAFGSISGFSIFTPSTEHFLATQPHSGLALSICSNLNPGNFQDFSTLSTPRAPGAIYNWLRMTWSRGLARRKTRGNTLINCLGCHRHRMTATDPHKTHGNLTHCSPLVPAHHAEHLSLGLDEGRRISWVRYLLSTLTSAALAQITSSTWNNSYFSLSNSRESIQTIDAKIQYHPPCK